MRYLKPLVVLFIVITSCNEKSSDFGILVDYNTVNDKIQKDLGFDLVNCKKIIDSKADSKVYTTILTDLLINGKSKLLESSCEINVSKEQAEKSLVRMSSILKENISKLKSEDVIINSKRAELQRYFDCNSENCSYRTLDFIRLLSEINQNKVISDEELGYLIIYDFTLHYLTVQSLDNISQIK